MKRAVGASKKGCRDNPRPPPRINPPFSYTPSNATQFPTSFPFVFCSYFRLSDGNEIGEWQRLSYWITLGRHCGWRTGKQVMSISFRRGKDEYKGRTHYLDDEKNPAAGSKIRGSAAPPIAERWPKHSPATRAPSS